MLDCCAVYVVLYGVCVWFSVVSCVDVDCGSASVVGVACMCVDVFGMC